jgi:serine/threonine-protein kinase
VPERYLGKTLGKYRVEELIGSGGFSWVYRGFDPELEIPVALKVLKPQFAGDPTFEERFRREASTAAKLRHPNIVKIYAVGRDGDAVYFAMDYLPSGLAEKLEAMPTLPEEFAIRVGIDVARALGFAHREGVIHRDIKVDNILFDAHGNAVVADFGIARAVSGYTQQTGTNMVVGTPQYFAPEQARAKPLDGRADIYSLGVSLFRATTGRLPFEGDDWYEIARQHVEEAPPRIRALNPLVTGAFEQLVLKCLSKHPDDRPSTGEQLADQLVELLSMPRETTPGRSALRSPNDSPTLVTTPRSRKRKRALLVPLGVGAAVVAAVALPLVIAQLVRNGSAVAPDSAVAATLPAVDVLPGDALLRPDSLLADTATRGVVPRDSGAGPSRSDARLSRLAVSAPEGAVVLLDGVLTEGSSWTRDSLRPGAYTVRATIPAEDRCETARDETKVTLRAGATQRVTLNPRPCGTLSITVRNVGNGARYTVLASSRIVREGALPLDGPIVLPVGDYLVRIQQPGCDTYEEPGVGVAPRAATTRTLALNCGNEPASH